MRIEVERQNANYDERGEDDFAHTAGMILDEGAKSDAKTARTPKALRAKINADTSRFCASRRSFLWQRNRADAHPARCRSANRRATSTSRARKTKKYERLETRCRLVAAVMMIGRRGFGKFSGFVSYPGEAELSHRSSRMKRGDRIRRTRLWQYK
jgi:hypothetical protein